MGEFYGRTGGIKEGLALAFNAPPIFAPRRHRRLRDAPAEPRRGRRRSASREVVAAVHRRARCRSRASRRRRRSGAPNVPQLYVDVDREKAKALGVPLDEVFNALAATLGTYYVNDFNKYGRTWQVLMSAGVALPQAARGRGRRLRAQRARARWCRSARSRTVEVHQRPDTLERFNNLPAVTGARRGRARRELGPGAREDREGRQGSAARRLQLRLERRLVPGEALGRHLDRGAGARARSWRSSSSPRSTRSGRCRSR